MKTQRLACAAALLLATAGHAQSVAVTPDERAVVAHDGRIDVFRNGKVLASYAGVATSGAIAASDRRAAVADPLTNELRIVDLASGKISLFRTGETPVAVFLDGDDAYVVARDARTIERIAADGARSAIPTGVAAELLRETGGRLYLYSRVDGLLQEIAMRPLRLLRETRVASFASDLEVDGRNAYLAYPAEGSVQTVALATLKVEGQMRVGGVPVDLAIGNRGSALTARALAVADPSSKKVWVVEGRQSVWEAFARGFLRGLLGLGLFAGRDPALATGADRVTGTGPTWLAYDSSAGVLYRVSKSRSEVLADSVGPRAFAVQAGRAWYWRNGTLVAQKLSR